MTNPSDFDIAVSKDIEEVRRTQRVLVPFDWFARLWALAVVAHIVGNPRVGQAFGDPTLLGWSTLATGLVAVAVVIKPNDRKLLQLMCLGVLVVVWLEAPVIGNHWLLTGLVSAAVLVSLAGGDSWNWFTTTARGMHLVFYVFAAFAKLNSSFFDSTVSCGVVYANQALDSVGLPQMSEGSLLAVLVIWATAIIELSVPVLLVRRSTRNLGVLLGIGFHTLISFDLTQHFYDFTAVLIPLFLLWARPALLEPLGKRLTKNAEYLVASLLSLLVVASVVPLGRITASILIDGVFVAWLPASIALFAFVVRGVGHPADVSILPPNAVAWLLVGLVFVNGLTPYLELKTGTSWNMYANLLTADGESNHFIVRSTIPLSNAQGDPIEILESSDPGLAVYVDSGYVLAERTLLDYLAGHSGVEARIRKGDRVETVTSADGSALNPLLDRFALLRAIDTERPVRCQTIWLPAG